MYVKENGNLLTDANKMTIFDLVVFSSIYFSFDTIKMKTVSVNNPFNLNSLFTVANVECLIIAVENSLQIIEISRKFSLNG